jgi:sn-glycerol 3-phosphate transport system permease protein
MNRRNPLLPYLLITPTLLFVAMFTIFPLLSSIITSFYKQRLNIPKFREPVWDGLGNYRELLSDEVFRQVISNTGIYVLVLVPLCVTAAFLLALMLHAGGGEGSTAVLNRRSRNLRRTGKRMNGFYRTAFFYPTVIPMVSAATIWMFFFTPDYGLFNRFLLLFGYRGAQNWAGNPDLALAAVLITAFWKSAGYYMIFYLAGLQNLPKQVFEAAVIDGAGPLRILMSITIPLLRRTTLFVTTIAFIGTFQSVDHIFVLTGGGPSDRSSLLLYHLWQVRFDQLNVGEASAITVILVLLLLLFTVSNFIFNERGER